MSKANSWLLHLLTTFLNWSTNQKLRCNLSLKHKLQILQNRAARVISNNYTSPIEQVFAELKLLNVQQLIDFDSAALICKSQNGLAPKYISDMFVPSNNIHGHDTRHIMNDLFNSHVNSTY